MEALIINNIKEFEGFKEDWDRLFDRSLCKNIFLTFDWHNTWWKYFGRSRELFIVKVVENEEAIGIAPLFIEKNIGFRCLNFIGSNVSDFEEFLILGDVEKRNSVVECIFDAIQKNESWDIFRLKKIKESSGNYQGYREVKDKIVLIVSLDKHNEGAPYLENPGDWDKYSANIKAKFLSDTRRRNNKLSQLGEVSYSGNVTDVKEFDILMKKLKELHISRRKIKGEKSFLAEDYCFRFFCDIAKNMNEKGILHLSCLRLNEKIVALHFGFLFKDHFGYQIPVFDQEYKPYAVSRLLLLELIKECFNSGVKKFDFMLGDEGYKNDWNPKVEPLYFLTCVPKNFRGFMAKFIYYDLNLFVKKVLQKSW